MASGHFVARQNHGAKRFWQNARPGPLELELFIERFLAFPQSLGRFGRDLGPDILDESWIEDGCGGFGAKRAASDAGVDSGDPKSAAGGRRVIARSISPGLQAHFPRPET